MTGHAVLATVDPVTGLAHMLAHPYMVRAFEATSLIALACGVVGYFVVLRGQVFTGDALSHVAFTGALAALVAGIDLRLGLFGACIAAGIGMALLDPAGRADDVVVGNTFAWILGLGVLLLAVDVRSRTTGATAGVTVLFGSVFGLSANDAAVAAILGAVITGAVLLVARPLLFASIDEDVAAAAGVPVRALGVAFLAVVGATAGEATQAVGALLLLGLLAAPAAAARRLTGNPWAALTASAGLAVGAAWAGLVIAYVVASIPPSFAITAVAATTYAAAGLIARVSDKKRSASGPDLTGRRSLTR